MTGPAPLIVSAVLADEAQDDLDAQRTRFFPEERRHVGAHLTLFHALPGERHVEVVEALDAVTRREAPALTVAEPFGMGHGVGYRLESPALEEVRDELAREFAGVLTDQDAQRWRPHVTVQNKVSKDEARRTLEIVGARHEPYGTLVEALALWHYRHGPWEPAGTFRFGRV